MRVLSELSFCAITKALLANELPDLGNPSMTSCVSGVTKRSTLRRVRNNRNKVKYMAGWPPA
jgi:hypothetical protein